MIDRRIVLGIVLAIVLAIFSAVASTAQVHESEITPNRVRSTTSDIDEMRALFITPTPTPADCAISSCQLSFALRTLKPKQYLVAECHEDIVKDTDLVYNATILGNNDDAGSNHSQVAVFHLFESKQFRLFSHGLSATSLLVDSEANQDSALHAMNGTHRFTKYHNIGNSGGLFFVLYNDDLAHMNVSLQVSYHPPAATAQQNATHCGKHHTGDTCPTDPESDCVWCRLPCQCMERAAARDDCIVGWGSAYTGFVEDPSLVFDTWSIIALSLFGILVFCVVALFIQEGIGGLINMMRPSQPVPPPDYQGIN